ncbi:MAG: hypothetical protein ACRD6N_15625, partial [Pyrinomonadaceae bacterium]
LLHDREAVECDVNSARFPRGLGRQLATSSAGTSDVASRVFGRLLDMVVLKRIKADLLVSGCCGTWPCRF